MKVLRNALVGENQLPDKQHCKVFCKVQGGGALSKEQSFKIIKDAFRLDCQKAFATLQWDTLSD